MILGHLGNFGSFLSFWVILGHFGSFWVILGYFGSFWVILGDFGSFWSFWVILVGSGDFG